MKNITKVLITLWSIGAVAQVNVSTLTTEFKGSGGLSLDSNGILHIGDFGDFLGAGDGDGQPNNVWQMDANSNLTVYSGDFVGASGNAFDSNGVLYQNDIVDSAVYRIVNNSRELVTTTGISNPVGIVFDSNDNFYVCNCGNNTIRKVTPGGVSTQFSNSALLFCPNGITIDEDDNLYISNFSNGNIVKINPAGQASLLNTTPAGTTSGPSNGHLDYHQSSRTLFIASHASSKIFALNIDNPSNLVILAGSGARGNDDGPALSATFSRPNGVAVTQTGDSIYINSSIPVTNVPNRPLNPSVIRLITGVQSFLSVAENDAIKATVKTYPNPVKDEFTIEANLLNPYSGLDLRLYDINGRTVKEVLNFNSESEFKKTITISELNSGHYFYAIYQGTKQLFNGQLIKQ